MIKEKYFNTKLSNTHRHDSIWKEEFCVTGTAVLYYNIRLLGREI